MTTGDLTLSNSTNKRVGETECGYPGPLRVRFALTLTCLPTTCIPLRPSPFGMEERRCGPEHTKAWHAATEMSNTPSCSWISLSQLFPADVNFEGERVESLPICFGVRTRRINERSSVSSPLRAEASVLVSPTVLSWRRTGHTRCTTDSEHCMGGARLVNIAREAQSRKRFQSKDHGSREGVRGRSSSSRSRLATSAESCCTHEDVLKKHTEAI